LGRAERGKQLPQLVLAGKRGWLEAETMRAAEQSDARKDILFIGYVPDADLASLYSGALCFAYPSYFEGFGLPVLEAMQCGTAVIAGNRTSLPEAAGDAAILVDPFDEAAIANGLNRVIEDPAYRAELRVKGFERSAAFSWKTTAQLTLQAYERAALAAQSQ
jgi:glycosyltransferase involved in cell wall biosynthesis